MIAAGKLKHQVTIERPVRTTDDAGNIATAWETVATAWANVTPLRDGEIARERHAQLETTHRVTIRWTANVNRESRLTFTTNGTARVLHVIGLRDPDEGRAILEITAKEVTA